jgi:signal transduction histidine kinase
MGQVQAAEKNHRKSRYLLGIDARPSILLARRIRNLDSPFYVLIAMCIVGALSYLTIALGTLVLRPQMIWAFWPGCAFLVAVLLLTPRKIWLPFLAAGLSGFVLYDVQAGLSIRTTSQFILADTVEILVAALGVSYFFGGAPTLTSIRSLAKYSLFAVILSPLFAAFLGAVGYGGEYWLSWRISFLSEALALLTLPPAILSCVDGLLTLKQRSRAFYFEAAAQIGGLAILGYITFVVSGSTYRSALLYSLVPFLLWSALRFGTGGTSTSVLVVTFLSIWGSVHGHGPFSRQTQLDPVLSLQLFVLFAAASFMVLAALLEERKRAEEALTGMSRKLIEAQEKERNRIGRDLHDDICQRLALLAIGLQQIKEVLPDSAVKTSSGLDELWKQTLQLATDVQALSHELHSSKLEYLGIVPAMRGFCREFSEQQRIKVDFTSHDLPNPLPSPEISLSLYRVLQEALHNAAKHSGVRHFEVQLWGTTDEIHLTVSDSGAGFDAHAAKQGRGLGLTSMEERLRLINGKLSIESQPRRGTTLHARVSLSSEPRSHQPRVKIPFLLRHLFNRRGCLKVTEISG